MPKISYNKGMEIEQIESTLKTSEIQVVVAMNWLKLPYLEATGGKQLAKWLEKNIDKVENIFGAEDRVYIKLNSPQANKELADLVIQNKISDHIQWMKFTDSERWWMLLWWDLDGDKK